MTPVRLIVCMGECMLELRSCSDEHSRVAQGRNNRPATDAGLIFLTKDY